MIFCKCDNSSDTHIGNNNKEAQLLLEKTRYSLYSSCCSIDL